MADQDRTSRVWDTLKKMQKNLECPICLEQLSDPFTTRCGHPFCRVCINTVISGSSREAKCPLCKERISKRSLNENSRLGEIVEAVKQLEQAIIEDTGIAKTPPRPLPPNSHEATGSPGIALHSLLHPSPVKRPRQRLKRTKNDIGLSASASIQPSRSTPISPAYQEPEADTKNGSTKCSTLRKGGGRHGKLSIKHRRKGVRLLPVEKPKLKSTASSSRNLLSMFADEQNRMENGNGKAEAALRRAEIENGNGMMGAASRQFKMENSNGKVETALKQTKMENGIENAVAMSGQVRMQNGNENMEAAAIFIEDDCPLYSRNVEEDEGAGPPIKKKAKLTSPLVSAKVKAISSQQVPNCSRQFGHDPFRVSETPVPQMAHDSFTVSISRALLSNKFTSQPELWSNKPSKVKNCNDTVNQIVCPLSEAEKPSVCITEKLRTPFVQVSELVSNSRCVTRVMETPFVSNILNEDEIVSYAQIYSGGGVEKCESMLANETEIEAMDDDPSSPARTPNKATTQTKKAEDVLSESFFAKETQDLDWQLNNVQSPDNSNSHASVLSDGECTILGPTQIASIPESQFYRSAVVPKPTSLPPQVVEPLPLSQKVEKEPNTQSQHNGGSCSMSPSLRQDSPVQSGGPVCIGETQFTKTGSKFSPELGNSPAGTCNMPSPPASPSGIHSPVIPLQNSTHQPCLGGALTPQQPLGSLSKIAETQPYASSDDGIVPSSQPSPTASKRRAAPASLLLHGLAMVQYCRPRLQATVEDEKISLEQQDVNQNAQSQPLGGQQNDDKLIEKSPSKSLTTKQSESEQRAKTSAAQTKTDGNVSSVNVPVSPMTLAYNLQSQQLSLQSQMSSSVDFSSQQLELLRQEMEAKQKEIDELEAALRQAEAKQTEKEIQAETPISSQSSDRGITAIADTMPSSNGRMMSPEQAKSPKYLVVHVPESAESTLSGPQGNLAVVSPKETISPQKICIYARDLVDNQQVAASAKYEGSLDHVSETVSESLVASSRLSGEPRPLEHSQIRESPLDSQLPSDESTTMKVQAIVQRTAPPTSNQFAATVKVKSVDQNSIKRSPGVTSTEAMKAHIDKMADNRLPKSVCVDKTAPLHSEIESDADSDCSETQCTSQSVLATLQAADEVLRKLRSPPLALLEERSSMEIDTDLYSSGTTAHHKLKSLKAKKLRNSGKMQASVVQKDAGNSVQATMEIDSQLFTDGANTADESPAQRGGKGSSRGKRVHSISAKSKSTKKKKAALVMYESEETLPRLPRFRNRNQANTSQSPTTAQSHDQGDHCSRRGSTTPTSIPTDVLLQTPKPLCSSSGGSSREVSTVSHHRPLSAVGKDHPPSYIGSGLSKTQLREVQTLARRYGGRLASCFNGNTSHVIVSANENGLCSRTVKYLQGVATGRWIVSYQWVKESLDAGRLLQESEYEVVGDHVTIAVTRAPMRSRQLHLKGSTGLFAGCVFLFIGAFGSISRDYLAQLIELSGGGLVSSTEETALGNRSTFVVCDEEELHLPSGSGLVQVRIFCRLQAPNIDKMILKKLRIYDPVIVVQSLCQHQS